MTGRERKGRKGTRSGRRRRSSQVTPPTGVDSEDDDRDRILSSRRKHSLTKGKGGSLGTLGGSRRDSLILSKEGRQSRDGRVSRESVLSRTSVRSKNDVLFPDVGSSVSLKERFSRRREGTGKLGDGRSLRTEVRGSQRDSYISLSAGIGQESGLGAGQENDGGGGGGGGGGGTKGLGLVLDGRRTNSSRDLLSLEGDLGLSGKEGRPPKGVGSPAKGGERGGEGGLVSGRTGVRVGEGGTGRIPQGSVGRGDGSIGKGSGTVGRGERSLGKVERYTGKVEGSLGKGEGSVGRGGSSLSKGNVSLHRDSSSSSLGEGGPGGGGVAEGRFGKANLERSESRVKGESEVTHRSGVEGRGGSIGVGSGFIGRSSSSRPGIPDSVTATGPSSLSSNETSPSPAPAPHPPPPPSSYLTDAFPNTHQHLQHPHPFPPHAQYGMGEEDEEVEQEEEEEEEEEVEEGVVGSGEGEDGGGGGAADSDLIEIFIETLTGTTFQLRVSRLETVGNIKKRIFRMEGIPMNQQHLLRGREELVDNLRLVDHGVYDGSSLKLVLAMRGGPINSRRHPTHEDLMWHEVTEFMDMNRDELWDGAGPGGRAVTLLVLREGDQVNLYRVVENEDGSFSPLNESWGSNHSTVFTEEDDEELQRRLEEDVKTRTRMAELRRRMGAVKMRSKEEDLGEVAAPPQVHREKREKRLSASREARDLSESLREIRDSRMMERIERLGTGRSDPGMSSRPSTRRGGGGGGGGGGGSLKLPPVNPRALPRSRPSTQERSIDLRRTSLSRSSMVRDAVPNMAPRSRDFSGKTPLDDIKPLGDRRGLQTLDKVEEERVRFQSRPAAIDPASGNTTFQMPPDKNYDSYRKSLVKHSGLSTKTQWPQETKPHEAQQLQQLQESHEPHVDYMRVEELSPKREGTVPLYMGDPLANSSSSSVGVRRKTPLRLNRSHNGRLLKVPSVEEDDRPRTSPEVLERRADSAGMMSSMSDRVQLMATDDRLRELCSILNTSRSRLSHRPPDSPPLTAGHPHHRSLTQSFNEHTLSLSMASVKSSNRGTPPGPGALVTSGSREQRDILREIMRAQGSYPSRRSTPEDLKKGPRRLTSGRIRGTTSPGAFLPPVTPNKKKKRRRPRCDECGKKLGITNTYLCRCSQSFCSQHRHAETHSCTFDYKTEGRKLLQVSNPVVAPSKLPKI